MIRALVPFTFILFNVALAGDYQPDPAIEYTFDAPQESPGGPTEEEKRWARSLTTNLRKGGGNPNVVFHFARSTATFSINGEPQVDFVFVSRDDPDVYFIVKDNYARFIINFKKKYVSARNYGNSLFIPPSKSFCVLVLDRKHWPPGGIPVSSAPGNQEIFEGRVVSWH